MLPTCITLGVKRLFKCVYLCNNANDTRVNPSNEHRQTSPPKRDTRESTVVYTQ